MAVTAVLCRRHSLNGISIYIAVSEVQREHPTAIAPLQKPIRVLLAEDHAPNVLVAKTLLENMGFRCDVTHTGKEVLAKIDHGNNGYDLILMDVQMPELDSCVTTRLLREEERKERRKRTPIIGVTAHALSDNVKKCFEAGMDDYIAKPFSADHLRQKISLPLKQS